MVTRNKVPAAVEGSKITIAGKNIIPVGSPKKLPDTNEVIYQLKADGGAESTIEVENLPKISRIFKYSLLSVGDKISGKHMWGFSSDPIGSGDLTIGGRGRSVLHTGQELTIFGTCCMVLIEGWRGSAISVHPKGSLFQVE